MVGSQGGADGDLPFSAWMFALIMDVVVGCGEIITDIGRHSCAVDADALSRVVDDIVNIWNRFNMMSDFSGVGRVWNDGDLRGLP